MKPMDKIVSMCVYGSDPKYWRGAIANARLMPVIYPGWILRVYIEEHNPGIQTLMDLGVQVYVSPKPPGIYGMFWRFLPVAQNIERVIVRDADSRINAREKAAVDDWMVSGKTFHVMRDHPHHAQWPVLGGMWGAKGGSIPDIRERIKAWGKWGEKLDDMRFLAQNLWQEMKPNAKVHSSVPDPLGGDPFPPHGPSGSDFVGQVFDENNVKDATR